MADEVQDHAELPAEEAPFKPTARQAAFVSEYLVDLNGTKAAIRAGYAHDSAAQASSQLLRNINIARLIEKAKESRAAKIGMTAEQVVHEISLLSNASPDWFEVDELGYIKAKPSAPEGAMRAISSVSRKEYYDKEGNLCFDVQFKLVNKNDMLKLMGKHVGVKACTDKMEHSGLDGKPIEHVTRIESVVVDPKAEAVPT